MKSRIAFLCLCIFLVLTSNVYAHSGRTDASGGHNCSDASITKGLCDGYHFHNGGGSSAPSTPSSAPITEASWDKDCGDFSSYDEVVNYWNSKGYTAQNDPEKLDGWGNTVDDGIPCEAPTGYDTLKINGSPAQVAKIQADNDRALGDQAGNAAGLAAGQQGESSNPTSEGTPAYQEGYKAGYDRGYVEGKTQFDAKKETAIQQGYEQGKIQDDIAIPEEYAAIESIKASFEEGFNKAINERENEYVEMGIKDGKLDVLNEPKEVKDIYIQAYKEGYEKGQKELKDSYVKQGYEAAFKFVNYKEPQLKEEKYIKWYKEGFESNKEIEKIKEAAFQAGLDGEENLVPAKYAHAEPIYSHSYELGVQQNEDNAQTGGAVIGLGVLGWFGRRFYIARKMIK